MSIETFENARKTNFTMIQNEFVNDPEVTLQSKGLLTVLLSNTEDWKIIMANIIKRSKNGRDAHYKTILELIKAGYYARITAKEGGKFKAIVHIFSDVKSDVKERLVTRLAQLEGAGYECVVEYMSEKPKRKSPNKEPFTESQDTDEKPFTENPDTENPDTEKPDTESQYYNNTRDKNTNLDNTKLDNTNLLKEKEEEERNNIERHKIRRDYFVQNAKERLEDLSNFPPSICEEIAINLVDEKKETTLYEGIINAALKDHAEAQRRGTRIGNLTKWFAKAYVTAKANAITERQQEESIESVEEDYQPSVPFYNWLEQ
jgi:hypothetical protein